MSDRNGLNVVIGAGPSGRGVAERLASLGRPVRVVTRSGKAAAPGGHSSDG